VASLMLPSAVKLVQNPTATFAIVVQEEIPNGQFCTLSLVAADDFEINGRQLSDVAACAANDENTLKFNVREVVAMKNGLSQGAQVINIRLASALARAAILSSLVKLHCKKEFTAATTDPVGNDMTAADW
jgi:hypothetical protein